MAPIIQTARAKINLTLRVLGKRADGYHEIESLVAFADIGDGVVLDVDAAPGVETHGPFAADISGGNLIDKTLALLVEQEPRLRLGRVRLDKRLPVAAGMGGGSADAAAVLRAVRSANADLAAAVDWWERAAQLGADVPVCLADGPAIMRGIGEIVVPIDVLPILDVVLVNPLAVVPPDKTARVFKALAAPPIEVNRDRDVMTEGYVDRNQLLVLMRIIGNDLAAPASHLMPAVATVLAALRKIPGVKLVQMSGAGPTCFGVFASRAAAEAAAIVMRQAHPGWWIEAASVG